MTNGETSDVANLSSTLALDTAYSDYDLWRAHKSLDDELYKLEREHRPIPIDVLYARRILSVARTKRAEGHATGRHS
ncbi:hypothetical protein [Neoaquamicrobium microcysteis]|jgi:hypothetical protein|uniref:hypothetical protein n=1 Tax=Neoaquamicrobium microcysteis TaxID=2682781 RepID=UPI001F183549|nr:hypothetical protein [Mesorhizobium microcysteis]